MTTEQLQKITEVGRIYTPAYPIEIKDLFSGRKQQLQRAISFIPQKGYHLMVYGDRGVGKTSFANVLMRFFETSDRQVTRVSCSSKDTYDGLWRSVFAQFMVDKSRLKHSIGFNGGQKKGESKVNLSSQAGKAPLTTAKVLSLLAHLQAPIIVLDEFDRLDTSNFDKGLFTDTIKAISDTMPHTKVVIVGVSEDISNLIVEHESIERNLGQIHIPVMSAEEVIQIVQKGEAPLGLEFAESVVNKIVELSSGYPHFTHALCYHSCNTAILNESTTIDEPLLHFGIHQTLDNAHESLSNAYRVATLATKQNIFSEVLYAASLAPVDEYGYFQAKDLEPILSCLLNRSVKTNNFTFHLGKFSTEERGQILKMTGTKNRQRYKFKNPLMRSYIKLKNEESR
ncbi:MAG: ATP-binding protein [Bacteroidota bacterium]